MAHFSQTDKEALDHLEKAIENSHEMEPILKLFETYPQLEVIRDRELSADMEDCYGLWLGGGYYWKALDIAIQQWLSSEKTKEQVFCEDLQKENARLKQENAELRRKNERMTATVLHFIMDTCNRAEIFGDEFRDGVERWHRNCVKRAEEEGV